MSSSTKTYTLRSNDNETFEVSQPVAMMSQTIKHFIEDDESSDNGIPLPMVESAVLAKIVKYCNKHAPAATAGDAISSDGEGTSTGSGGDTAVVDGEDFTAFDKEFMKVDQKMLFDLILAANYLNIKELLDLTCQTVADMMKGKSPEDIRQMFNIVNDFTPEEEAAIRAENTWAFDS